VQKEDHIQKLPRKERERLQRQRDLLEVAEEVFSRKGFHNATIQEISEKSEFAVGSIYYMFTSKDEIYLALLQMRFEEYLSILEQELEKTKDPLEKVRVFIQTRFAFFFEHKMLFRLILNTTYGPQWDVRNGLEDKLINRYEEHLRLLAGIIQEGVRMNLFAGKDSFGMALAIEGMINAFVGYWIRNKDKEFTFPKKTTVEEVFFRGILKTRKKL
jgi:AcrR family transcriptional regulator